jgi:UDP:flavonoid glycosyltransferase YjiC (YdhE family)
MATPDAGRTNHHGAEEVILRDGQGGAVVPTAIPPATEFEDFGKSRSEPSNMGNPAKEVREDSDESYFDARTRQQSSAGLGEITPVRPEVTRVFTAPEESGRPKAMPRQSTMLAGLKKRGTAAGVNEDRRVPYSYTFDPMESDSSSSEDEEEQDVKKTETGNEDGKEDKTQQMDHTDLANEQQRKKRAKEGHSYSRFSLGNEHVRSKGRISKRDGRLNISIHETANSGYVAKALGQSMKNHLDIPRRHKHTWGHEPQPGAVPGTDQSKPDETKLTSDAESLATSLPTGKALPKLNIVIMVIGSRGDIQPFLKIAKILKNDHGHRVRIASHPVFRDFVEKENDMEFFSVGGDPSELMAFMVKNPGLIPNLQTIREGEIQRRRAAMAVMFEGFWRACINATDDEKDINNLKMLGEKKPFVADAIIANPPSMAHVHIAEKLGIPLHVMFTFPYTPTQAFPHPLANVKTAGKGKKGNGGSNVDESYVNFSEYCFICGLVACGLVVWLLTTCFRDETVSYPLVEMMTWQGLGDIVNRFRENTLNLEPVSSLWAPGALYRMKVPYTYLWSPSLVPKPKDWGPEVDIAGFVFLDLASKFKPDRELEEFLNKGKDPPVYIGFGSIVVDDPNAFTDLIFKAVELAGVRALVNKGWGGLGRNNANTPDHIFMLGNTPHDWLFPRVSAVVHHGGAGTTAIGLKCARPTMIVPFFGDQPFWGARVAEAGAGAKECVPFKNLTAEKLAKGIRECLTPEARESVQRIAESMAKEGDGAENAVKSFHRSLPLAGRQSMRCSILEDRVAVWQIRHSTLRLSALAAEILHQKNKIKWSEVKLRRHIEWNDFDGPGEPITGTVGALKDGVYEFGQGVGMVPVRIARHVKKHEEHQRKREERERRREERRRRKAASAADGAPEQRPQIDRNPTSLTLNSTLSSVPSEPLPRQLAEDVGEGVKKSGAALLTLPNDLHVAIAQGFHNAPRLWGDATVRKPIRITGFKSGAKAAGKEFIYGLYDGWTGLIMQPVKEWKDQDSMWAKIGMVPSGVGKGVGGFVMKNLAAVVGPPAFLSKGALKWAGRKIEGEKSSKGHIRRAQILRGQLDLKTLEQERQRSAEPSTGSQVAGEASASATERQQAGDPCSAESQAPAASTDPVKEVEDRVLDGWKVYQEIWETAGKLYPGRILSKWRFQREKRKWDGNGVLENVGTAKQALQKKKQGEDLQEFFERRRAEVRRAEGPSKGVAEEIRRKAGAAGGVAGEEENESSAQDAGTSGRESERVQQEGETEFETADEEDEDDDAIEEEDDEGGVASDATTVVAAPLPSTEKGGHSCEGGKGRGEEGRDSAVDGLGKIKDTPAAVAVPRMVANA